MHVLPDDVTDDSVGDRLVGHQRVAGLVDEGDRRAAKSLGPALGKPQATGVRRDDRDLRPVDAPVHVAREQRQGEEVVDRTVEEPLDLRGVQVDGHQAVGAGGLEEVGHQAGRDRLAAAVLLVLAGVAVERGDHGDALRGSPLERVDHDELLHQPLVQRCGVALDHEGVAAADRLLVADEDLAVGEVVRRRRRELDAQLLSHRLGELRVRPAREDHQLLLARRLDEAHAPDLSSSPLSSGRAAARSAASAVRVPARRRATHPAMLRCLPRATASSPGATSVVMVDPAAT